MYNPLYTKIDSLQSTHGCIFISLKTFNLGLFKYIPSSKAWYVSLLGSIMPSEKEYLFYSRSNLYVIVLDQFYLCEF